MCNFRAGSDDDLTAFPDSAKIKYEAVLDERYFYTNGLIYMYVEKRQSFCTMYALGGAVDIFALSLSLHPRCIVTSIDNVFWFIQTMEFVRPTDRLKLKGCIVAHRRIKIFTISIFGPPHVKFPLGKHSSEYRFNHLSNFNDLSCPYFSNVCTSIHGDLYRGGGGWLIFHNLLPYYFYIPSKLATKRIFFDLDFATTLYTTVARFQIDSWNDIMYIYIYLDLYPWNFYFCTNEIPYWDELKKIYRYFCKKEKKGRKTNR